ncbi:hypothetical protein C3492_15015 [Streptomyces sp. Ru62]|nr:hypothetical protein C3492_15015 [Streptomyces sp. Ru62]
MACTVGRVPGRSGWCSRGCTGRAGASWQAAPTTAGRRWGVVRRQGLGANALGAASGAFVAAGNRRAGLLAHAVALGTVARYGDRAGVWAPAP